MAHLNSALGAGRAHGNGFHGDQVLTSWKDIANYLGKGVRTVQRWEQDFGLPVRRPVGSNKKAVLARPHDLDAWVALRCRSRAARKDGAALAPGELPVLSSLVAEMDTARALREISRTAREELHVELISLQQRLATLRRHIMQSIPSSSLREM